MALPTIHWHRFAGVLTTGQSVIITHTLRTGEYPNGVIPDAVEADMNSGTYVESPNQQIGEYQARTSQFVYLSNFDWNPRFGAHFYAIIARKFHSINGQKGTGHA